MSILRYIIGSYDSGDDDNDDDNDDDEYGAMLSIT
jgi:hypothetical protein